MNDKTQSTAVATTAPSPRPVVMVEHTQALFDSARFDQFQRVASALKFSSILSPSIRGNSPEQCFSNLMIVCEMAERWQMSPTALAQSMSIIHDKVVYEGKAIHAALESTLGIELYPWWTGERGTDGYRIFLSDKPWDDLEDEVLENLKPGVQIKGRKIVDGSVGEWKTSYQEKKTGVWRDNPSWQGAASQDQLLYRASRQWARRYKPALIMGVYADDEIEAIEERRERKTSAAVAPITAGFSASAKAEDHSVKADDLIEDAVVEEVENHVPDAGEMVEEEVKIPTGEERTKILNDAYQAGFDGRAFPVNMAWGEALIAEVEGQTELGRVNRMGEILDSIVGAVIAGNVPPYDDVPNEVLDEVLEDLKAAAALAHDFREAFLDHAREGKIYIEMEANTLTIGEGKSTITMSKDQIAPLLEEARQIIAALPAIPADTEPSAETGNPKTEEGQAVSDGESDIDPGEGNEGDDAEPEDDEDLEDAGDDADPWKVRLESCSSWVDIKTAFVALTKTEAWSAFDEEEQNRLRALTWARQQEINDSGAESLDMISDFTAFRCWIEYTDDADALEGNWQALCGLQTWVDAPVKIRGALVPAVRERLRALR